MNNETLDLAEACRDKAEQIIGSKWAELIIERFGDNEPEHFQTAEGSKLRERAKSLLSKELSMLGFVK